MGGSRVRTLRGWSVDLIPANANARHAALRRISGGLFTGFLVAIGLVLADGGLAQFQGEAGGFVITVFSAPVPLRVGLADLTVMVQEAGDRSDVLDCDVTLHLSKPGEEKISVAAKRAQAGNKLLYAAHPVLRKAGRWNVSVEIKERRETARVNGELTVLPELPPSIAYWPYFAVLPIAVTLFALNQWLKARRKVRNRRART
jgi:hypothetical protein